MGLREVYQLEQAVNCLTKFWFLGREWLFKRLCSLLLLLSWEESVLASLALLALRLCNILYTKRGAIPQVPFLLFFFTF